METGCTTPTGVAHRVLVPHLASRPATAWPRAAGARAGAPLVRRLAALLTLGLLAGAAVAGAAPATAAARVSITSELGTAVVSLDEPTTISVSGTGFQSIQGGFGGIYVLFGWVDDGWRPSAGGQTGADYLYVPDSEAKDNNGYQRFVTFPGSGTAAAANGGELAADGSWSLSMVVPGPTFQAVDRDGATASVDCREVTCGIITIGAHGVVNANNETFTPVTFAGAGSSTTGDGGAGTSGDGGTSAATDTTDDPATGATKAAATPSSGPATIGLEQSTIIVGRVLAFTGIGFTPGEQVVAVLGAGETGAGPLIAGQLGEVAGAMTLPADLRTGTHVLQLVGAGSGQVAEATVTVMADPAALTLAEQADQQQLGWPEIAVLVAAAVLLLLVVSSLITALVRRRRRRRAARAAAQDGAPVTETPPPTTTDGPRHAGNPTADTAVIPVRRSTRERVDA